MRIVTETLGGAALATAIAIAGGAIGAFASRGVGRERLGPLIAIAGGALLAVALLGILPEAAEQIGGWWIALLTVATGYGLFFLIGKYIYPICPACAADHDHGSGIPDATGARNISLLLALTVTIHAFVDGMAVSDNGSPHLTLPLLLAVGLHKLPEGLALAALLRATGRTPVAAFRFAASIESATLLGGIVGSALFASVSPLWCGVVLAHLAGGFLYLVLHGFWGGWSVIGGRTRPLTPPVGYALVGFISVALLLYLVSH